MLNLDYDDMFKISIWALKINRSYPTIPKDKIWLLTIIPIHGLFCFVFYLIVNSMIYHDLKTGNFSAACTNGIFSVLFICVSFKYSVMITKMKDIIFAINKVKSDYKSANDLCLEEQAITSKYANRASWVTKIWLLTSCSTFSVFPMQVLLLTIYYYAKGDFRLVHMYQMTYPDALETNKDETYTYLFLLFLQMYYGFYTLLMYVGFTPLGLIFMLHACGRLEIVKFRISTLFDGERYDKREIRERLRNIVMPLQDVLGFVDLLKETFRVVYEVYMKATTVVFPIALYEILEALKEGRVSIEFMTFIVAGTVLCFAPCYYSDLLMEKGLDVRMSVYESGWEGYPDSAMRRTLAIILTRLERDVAIRTLFRTVNLDAFSEALKEGRVSIEFMTFIVAGTVLCFAPCYYSDLLMEKGLDVRMSVYESGWEGYPDSAMRRTLAIILTRLERDVAIRTLFRTVNLDAFSELCHQSYALFNVINAAWS